MLIVVIICGYHLYLFCFVVPVTVGMRMMPLKLEMDMTMMVTDYVWNSHEVVDLVVTVEAAMKVRPCA